MAERINEYEANYHSALSFLKQGLKEQALFCLDRALSQVESKHKTIDNIIYLDILDNLAILYLEKGDRAKAISFIQEGLLVKNNHTDLLFLKSLLLLDEMRYDEMLEAIIHYLLSFSETEASIYNYKYVHEGAIKEVYNNLLPTAYKYAFEYKAIRDIVEKLSEAANNEWLKKAYDIMAKIDSTRHDKEN
jgi:tetratricopeptide (TPR) repeat protein